MALLTCAGCGASFPQLALVCPRCGQPALSADDVVPDGPWRVLRRRLAGVVIWLFGRSWVWGVVAAVLAYLVVPSLLERLTRDDPPAGRVYAGGTGRFAAATLVFRADGDVPADPPAAADSARHAPRLACVAPAGARVGILDPHVPVNQVEVTDGPQARCVGWVAAELVVHTSAGGR